MRGLAMACTINRHQLRKEMHRTAADYWPIRYTVKVSEAAHAGMPLLEYCPDCTAAVDYRELTEEVERIVSNMDTKEG